MTTVLSDTDLEGNNLNYTTKTYYASRTLSEKLCLG